MAVLTKKTRTEIKTLTNIVRADELRPGDMIVGCMDYNDWLIDTRHPSFIFRIVIAVSIVGLNARVTVFMAGSGTLVLNTSCSDNGMCFFRRLV